MVRPSNTFVCTEGNGGDLSSDIIKLHSITGFKNTIVWWCIKIRIFYYVCVGLRRPALIWKTYRDLLTLRSDVWAGDLKKIYKVAGKYYFNQYTPGWPSKAYDKVIQREIKRRMDPSAPENLSFVFLAITRKCPMRCEHCFEWDNLNQKESFTREELVQTADLLQKQGVFQFHFSGGEPMVRFKDLLHLMKFATEKSECWVVTSGFNFTKKNAQLLKSAGCTGVVVSIDHYKSDLHNLFRGNNTSFDSAVNAVLAAKQAGLVVSISVCATKSFIEGAHLLPYMDFARELGVHFVQVLEPKNVGHYENKDVLLTSKHIEILDKAFKLVNHSPDYRDYPTMLYHGYHQRRVGCFSGSRSVYVDSIGDVHACPFCHTKSYNILDMIRSNNYTLPQKANACPRYDKVV
jgi:MoaA/NifB/PqqE/SkfB family radical SAM enzyme